MDDPIGRFAGSLLVAIIGIWGVAFLCSQFAKNLQQGKVVDQTLSEFDATDRPGMATMQAIGFVLLIIASMIFAVGGILNAMWSTL